MPSWVKVEIRVSEQLCFLFPGTFPEGCYTHFEPPWAMYFVGTLHAEVFKLLLTDIMKK